MAKVDVLDILRAKKCTPAEFDFDNLWIPPMYCYLLPQDIESLRYIATSLKLSSKINEKYKMIDNIMRSRGFKRFSAGTNRVVYSCLEDDRFVVKIAVDKVGMQDNPMEYKNQFLLKPYVAKMFYHSPCGTVGFVERVLPIKNKAEFKEIASDVFDILVHKILGEYVMEDIGTQYFMNYGVRRGHAPVLLDYPYLYKLDGNRLYCTKQDPMTGIMCNGEIDYDAGFNHLVCNKCGKIYLASDLRDNSEDNKFIIKRGGNQMKVVVKQGDNIVANPIQVDAVMERPKSKPSKSEGLKVAVVDPNKGLVDFGESKPVEKAETTNSYESTRHNNDLGVRVINPEKKDTVVVKQKTVKTKNTETVVTVSKKVDNAVKEEKDSTTETPTPKFVKQDTSCDCDGTCEECSCGGHEEMDAVPTELQPEYDKNIKVDNSDEETASDQSEKEEEPELSKEAQDTIADLEAKYAKEEEPQKVVKRGRKPEDIKRDENGRFVSTKSSKKKSSKSNFIPTK